MKQIMHWTAGMHPKKAVPQPHKPHVSRRAYRPTQYRNSGRLWVSSSLSPTPALRKTKLE